MNLYECIYNLSYIIMSILHLVNAARNIELEILSSSYFVVPNTVGLQLSANVNNTSQIDDFEVTFVPDECCVDIDKKLNCDIVEIFGECADVIPKVSSDKSPDVVSVVSRSSENPIAQINNEDQVRVVADTRLFSPFETMDVAIRPKRRGSSKKLTLVAPLLNPFNYRGYCTAFIDSKPVDRKRRTLRNSVKIFFDTIIRTDQGYASYCNNIDEDSFNSCKPVNCDMRYNGRKPYFDNKIKRCVSVPKCISNDNQNLPDVIYHPRTNKCVRDNTITLDDFNYIKSLVHQNKRVPKDIIIVKKTRTHPKNYTKLRRNEDRITDIFDYAESGRFYKTTKKFSRNKIHDDKKHLFVKLTETVTTTPDCAVNSTMDGIVRYIKQNFNTLLCLVIITIFQLCLLCWLLHFLSLNVLCRCKNRLERHYYNNRENVSVTTPLIGTSNIETETTCPFMTESSNVDKKIQCYKACQRERAQVSLSDDILSKCLNRRKWELNQAKSYNISPEFSPFNVNTDVKRGVMQVSEYQQYSVYNTTNNAIDQKVNYENEKLKKNAKSKSSKSLKKSLHKPEVKPGELKEYTDSDIVLSERILKCHSFNYMGEEPQPDFTKASSDCYFDHNCDNTQMSLHRSQASENEYKDEKITGFKPANESRKVFTCAKVEHEVKTHSSEKGAQASFTNDSLDDFLSERGMIFLAGEDISKYSMESETISSVSSKTSKNHVLKNVLSLFRKKSKHCVSSDPGLTKSKESINLELIHMSRPTVYSSSNADSELINMTAKKIKDSRSSL